jgi:hypothetical protein
VSPDYTTYDNEGHGGHDHHTVVHIPTAVLHIPVLGNNLETEQGAEAEELTDETYHDQYPGIAKTIADTVEQ